MWPAPAERSGGPSPHSTSSRHPADPVTLAVSEVLRLGRLLLRALSRSPFGLLRPARGLRVLVSMPPARPLPPPRCVPSARRWYFRATPTLSRLSSDLRR